MRIPRVLLLASIPVCGWCQTPAASAIDQVLSEISPHRLRQNVERLVSFGTRHTLSDTASDSRGIGAARRWIYQEFSKLQPLSGGRLSVWFDEGIVGPARRIPQRARITNVVARLPGRSAGTPEGERIILVGAHYDSRATDVMDSETDAPGANDDGSGTAVVLELARVLSPLTFDATIVFVAFAGEEQGLFGSNRLAETAQSHGWNIEAVLNNDMVGNVEGADGSVDSESVRLFAEGLTPLDTGSVLRSRRALGLENDGLSRTLARSIVEIGSRYVSDFQVRMIYRRDRFLRGGDQSPFHDRGFAAVRFVESKENTDRQHRNVVVQEGKLVGDLPAFVNETYAAGIAKLNAAVIMNLARAPRRPDGVRIVLGGPVYESTLRWMPVHDPDLAGYRIRIRRTISPEWERTVFTTDTTITVNECKDDVLFGVEAVDQDGYVSLPAIPSAGR